MRWQSRKTTQICVGNLSAIRAKVKKDFFITIKLNSADLQCGGLTEEESLETILARELDGIDWMEISGETYEKPIMQLGMQKQSIQQRETYFLDLATQLRQRSQVNLMVTAGFRSLNGINQALQSDALDLVGLGRIFAIAPYSATLAQG